MKRTFATLTLVLMLPALHAFAAPRNEDALLTEDGTLFVVRSVDATDELPQVGLPNGSALLLATVRDGQTSSTIVPGSIGGGMNLDPTLAWDPDDERLYVVWQRRPGVASGEIVVTSIKQGRWSNEVTVGGGTWNWRQGLRTSLTHRVQLVDGDGLVEIVEGLTLHAVWWNQEGGREEAFHAMFTLDDGEITAHPGRPLMDLVARPDGRPSGLPHDADRDILRSPVVLETADPDTLDVYFADWSTGNFYLVTIAPGEQKNGRLRIPIGVAGQRTDPPLLNRATDRLEIARPAARGTSFVVFAIGDDAVEYVRIIHGAAEPSRTIGLDGDVTAERARDALERLARSNP